MIEVNINEESKIIHKRYKGVITYGEVYEGFNQTIKLSKEHECSRLIADFIQVTPKVTPAEAKELASQFKNKRGEFPPNIALLVDTPFQTAIAYFFKRFINKDFHVEIFSTYDAAVEWLLLSKN